MEKLVLALLFVGFVGGEVIDDLSFDYHVEQNTPPPLFVLAGDAISHTEKDERGRPKVSSGIALSRVTPSSAGALWSNDPHDASELAVVIDLHAAWQPREEEVVHAMTGDAAASFGFFLASNTAWINTGNTMFAGMNGEFQGLGVKLELKEKTKATISVQTRVPNGFEAAKIDTQTCTADFTKADKAENPSVWLKHKLAFPVRLKVMINHGMVFVVVDPFNTGDWMDCIGMHPGFDQSFFQNVHLGFSGKSVDAPATGPGKV
jgi:hypothetical protein